MKKFIMYGAGNIGRGFIGQTFSNAGYKVGFVDINMEVINKLNNDKEYPVDIVSNNGNVETVVKNVFGIDGSNIDLVSDEIASADIMATAIGVNVLKFIAKPIALGLKKRYERKAPKFNIIICENLIGADEFLKGLVKGVIPELSDWLDENVGFVEASIGRMVPVLAEEKRKGNILRVAVEPYNILPVDKAAFRGEIPTDVSNLYPFTPFNLFIQRKLFMHNMSHALTSYIGFQRGKTYIYEAIADNDIKYCAYKALMASALAVSRENQTDIKTLIDHADNLLYRFENKELGDTIARVGKDTKRKLSSNDRLIGALKLAEKHDVDASYICIGVAYGLAFNPAGDDSSIEVAAFAKENGVKAALKQYSEYEGKYVELIDTLYSMVVAGNTTDEIVSYVNKTANKEIRV